MDEREDHLVDHGLVADRAGDEDGPEVPPASGGQ